jgi:arsenite/tail-anchored protein-transporting ATPase
MTARALRGLTRNTFHFFAGKGGVGKTTCAAAAAVAAADGGERVLIVSTDPAHSLRDALNLPTSARATRGRTTPVSVALGRARGMLHAIELDADAALTRWIGERRAALKRIVGRGTYLDDDDIDSLLRLAFPGVDELIGLLELRRLAASGPWDQVVVDTAPTGHTLRLLAMPATLSRIAVVLDDMQAKHRFLAASLGGRYRPDAADALVDEIADAGRDLADLLRDRARVRVSWVLLPEVLALAEARDGVRALEARSIDVDEIVVNRVTPAPPGPCALCDGRRATESEVLLAVNRDLAERAGGQCRSQRALPTLDHEPRGVVALRGLARRITELAASTPRRRRARGRPAAIQPRRAGEPAPWLSAIAPPGRRLMLFAGKGGVGKTTAAAAVALALSAQRQPPRVLLLSTDPAHSLADVLDTPIGDEPTPVPGAPGTLRAREIDAASLFAARRRRYLDTVDAVFDALRGGSRFDPTYDRVVVEDLIDLAPPGIDELLGILTVTEALAGGAEAAVCDIAVVDTAPTGHALRLLAMPEAALEWVHAFMAILLKYRSVMGLGEIGQDLVTMARDLRGLRALLGDPARATVVAVTRPAALPRLETQRLLARLHALGIGVGAILVNAMTPAGCARCRRAAAREARVVAELGRERGSRRPGGRVIIQAPAVAPPPRGPAALATWRRAWTTAKR